MTSFCVKINHIIEKLVKAQTGDNIYDSPEQQLKNAKKKAENLLKAIQKIYTDAANGTMDIEIQQSVLQNLQQQYHDTKEQITHLENNQDYATEIQSSYESFFSLVNGFNHIEELTPEIVRTFIDRIEVGEKNTSARLQNGNSWQYPIRTRNYHILPFYWQFGLKLW